MVSRFPFSPPPYKKWSNRSRATKNAEPHLPRRNQFDEPGGWQKKRSRFTGKEKTHPWGWNCSIASQVNLTTSAASKQSQFPRRLPIHEGRGYGVCLSCRPWRQQKYPPKRRVFYCKSTPKRHEIEGSTHKWYTLIFDYANVMPLFINHASKSLPMIFSPLIPLDKGEAKKEIVRLRMVGGRIGI